MAALDRFATDYATLGSRALQLRNLLPLLAKGDGKKIDGRANPKAKPKATPVLLSSNHFRPLPFQQGNRKHGDKCPYRNSQKHCDKKKKSSGIGKATRKITDVECGTRTNIVMVGLKVNANEEIYASSNTARKDEKKRHLQQQKLSMRRPFLRSSAIWTTIAICSSRRPPTRSETQTKEREIQ